MASRPRDGKPRVVRKSQPLTKTFQVLIAWTYRTDPNLTLGKVYTVNEDFFFANASRKFEREAAILMGGNRLVYEDREGRKIDRKKTFKENGLVPAPPHGIPIVTATLHYPKHLKLRKKKE